ncbi:MAG: type IV secretion system protein [Actinomycetales bacterium]|nr:type IV secretion system protein [Actinomycetales bacterium]
MLATAVAGVAPAILLDDCSNPLNCLGQAVTASASSTLLGGLGSAFVQGSEQIARAAFASLDQTAAIDLSVNWFRANVGVIAAVTLPLVLGLLVIQVIGSVLRREPGGLVRAVVGVGKALVGAALALAVTQVALTAVDGVCSFIAGSAGTTVGEAAARFFDFARAASSVSPGLQFLLGLLMMVGFALLWGLMVFRKAALLLVAVFAPVAFAGQVWDATRAWTRRWLEVVAALVLCKVVIVVVFVLGASAFSGTGPAVSGESTTSPAPAFSDLLVGMLLLSIALFAPWVTWRFVHWGGLEAATMMNSSLAANPVQSGARSTTRLGTSVVQQVGVSAALGAMSGGAGAGAGAVAHGGAGSAGSRVGAAVAASGARRSTTRPAPPAAGARR